MTRQDREMLLCVFDRMRNAIETASQAPMDAEYRDGYVTKMLREARDILAGGNPYREGSESSRDFERGREE